MACRADGAAGVLSMLSTDEARELTPTEKKKPQLIAVGASEVVEPGGIEPPSVSHHRADLHV